jgi:hypothetical protein
MEMKLEVNILEAFVCSNSLELFEQHHQNFTILLDIWNKAGHILGSYTEK